MHQILRRYGFVPSILVPFFLILSIYTISCTLLDDQLNLLAINESTQVPSETQQEVFTTTTTSTTTSTSSSTTPSTTTTTTQNPEDLKIPVGSTCFYSEEELCSVRNVTEEAPITRPCDCLLHPLYKKALFCCNVTDIDKALNCANVNLTDLQHLHIRNASIDEIDFSGMVL